MLLGAYLLQHDARIEEIDSQRLSASAGGRDGDGAGGIAPKHVPAPFGSEVVGIEHHSARRGAALLCYQ